MDNAAPARRHDGGGALPKPADDQVRLLLQIVWSQLTRGAHWPSYGVVDRLLHQQHRLDVDDLLRRTSEQLLLGGRGAGGAAPTAEDQLRLTVAGAAACEGAEEAVQAFLRGVRIAARLEGEHPVGASEPSLTADQLIEGASDGTRRSTPDGARLARQVGLLLLFEPWTGSISLYEGGWRIGITRRVRPYIDVPDLDDYWARRTESRAAAEGRDKQMDRSGRQWACRSALVGWLFDVDAVESMTRSKTWEEFSVGARSEHNGTEFTDEEVDRAAAWLHRHKLLDGVTVAELDGPVRSYLTDRGLHCAERFDSDVRRYLDAMDQPQQPSSGPTINVNATNVQVATGARSHQLMTVSQTSDQLVLVIQGIVEMLQAFGVAAGRETDLTAVQQTAVADVTSDDPDGEGVRRFYDWVIECVNQGGTAAAVAAVTAASNGLLQDAEALVRAIGN